MTDDPKLLRAEADYYHGEWQKAVAENEKLRAALRPFADILKEHGGFERLPIDVAILYAAATAYRETGDDKVDG